MKRLFYDIETSPNIGLFWKSGYRLRVPYENIINERAIICICYKWQGEDEVYALTWNKGKDKAMLKAFSKVMQKADELVAHNGDRFDLPWVRTRCLKHGIDFSPYERTFDTLKKCRSTFNFNSNRLDYIGDFLGVGTKIDTNFGMWKSITLDHDQEALDKMVEYCKEDVRLLERVYEIIAPVTKHDTHAAVLDGGYRWQCPNCGGKEVNCNKTRTTRTGQIKRQMVCTSCKKYYVISNKWYMDMLTERVRLKELDKRLIKSK